MTQGTSTRCSGAVGEERGRIVSRDRRPRRCPAAPVGGFRYYGTRPDDPNDVVPHEHRRELRALQVFGAWTNLVDMKAGNTLDTVITENGRGDRPPLPAGCRLDVRHRRARAARRRRRVRIPVRGRSAGETAADVRLLPQPVADRRLRRASRDRPVRRATSSSPRSGSRACPWRRFGMSAPTTRSGRRCG